MQAPIDYPTITVAGTTFVLKYSLLAKYFLSRNNIREIDLLQALDEFQSAAQNAAKAGQEKFIIPARWLAAVIDAFAACVAHHYVGKIAPTSDEWAAKLDVEFEADLGFPMELYGKLRAAILKARKPSAPATVVVPAKPEATAA